MITPIAADIKDTFINLVLEHLAALPSTEWSAWRDRAKRLPAIPAAAPLPEDVTPEAWAHASLSEDQLGMQTLMNAHGRRAIEIGRIGSEPLYYLNGMGAWCWAPARDSACLLMLWATWPAYPEHW